jgi:hypothetical protein
VATGLPIEAWTNHSLSHDDESSFWTQRNSGVGERTTRRSNDFGAKIFAAYAQAAADVDVVQPSSSLEGDVSGSFLCRRFTLQIRHESFL